MRRIVLFSVTVLALLSAGYWFSRDTALGGKDPLLFTAAAQVTDLAVARDGTIWAGTKGGVVRWTSGQHQPEVWAAPRGLPGNEVRAVGITADGAWVAEAASLSLILPDGQVSACPLPEAGEIRDVLADGGVCRVAASNGVYQREGNTFRRILTCHARRLVNLQEQTWAITDRELVRLQDGMHFPLPDTQGNITAVASAGTRLYLATALGCWSFDGVRWQEILLPVGSQASHVSALALEGDTVLAALYDDGVYHYAGGAWTRITDHPALRHVTAFVHGARGWLAGTQEGGVLAQDGNNWKPLILPPAIPSGDVYGITLFRDQVWVATFDQGLLCRTRAAWRRVTRVKGLSSDSPRDLVVFGNQLYVRYTTGEVDCYDGRTWHPAFDKAVLPRQGVYAMATDGHRLYLGLWAGWATTDGKQWEYHFADQVLQGQVITAIAPQGETVWLGTQKAGLFAWRGGQLMQYHEAQGLTDDWITCFGTHENRLLVGTYNGGVLSWDGTRFTQVLGLEGFAARSLAFTGEGKALVASPLGVYQETDNGWRLLDPRTSGGLEAQTLCIVPDGVWVGTRTSLAYVPWVTATK